jgi:hypothetical protein
MSFDDAEMISPSNDTAYKTSHLSSNCENKMELMLRDDQ